VQPRTSGITYSDRLSGCPAFFTFFKDFSAFSQSRRYPDMLRSERVGELRIVQEHVVRQGIQEIHEVVIVWR
jgi:hypothetical protein